MSWPDLWKNEDTHEVLKAAGTNGIFKLFPRSRGGHCIGVDPLFGLKSAGNGHNPR